MALDDVTPTRRTFMLTALGAFAGGMVNINGNARARAQNKQPPADNDTIRQEGVEGAVVGGVAAGFAERALAFIGRHRISPRFGHHETNEERYIRDLRDREEYFRNR